MKFIFLFAALIASNACARSSAGEAALKIAQESTDADARWQAIKKIGELKYKPAVPLLMKSLGDPHPYVRANAARALSDMNISDAKLSLINLITDETDGGVIQQATLGLRKFKAVEALPALRKLAQHNDVQTRIWVVQTIGELGTKEDIALVASVLEKGQASEQSFAAQTLGEMTGNDFSIPPGPSGFENVEKAKAWWASNKSKYPKLVEPNHSLDRPAAR